MIEAIKDKCKKLNRSNKIGWVICILIFIVIVVSFFWTPYSTTKMDGAMKFKAPSLSHIFGTDNFGRDIFSRVMDGLQTTFIISVVTVLIGTVVGTVVGAVTGYFGGWIDEIVMRINDAVASFPSILLALVVISILGPGKYNVVFALGIVFIPSFARISRSEFINYKNRDYVKSAKLIGANNFRIMFVHMLPNAVPTILTAMVIGFNNAVLAEASMSYLGLGVQPPDASLGKMLAEAQGYIITAPWYTIFPSLTVVILIMGFVLISKES